MKIVSVFFVLFFFGTAPASASPVSRSRTVARIINSSEHSELFFVPNGPYQLKLKENKIDVITRRHILDIIGGNIFVLMPREKRPLALEKKGGVIRIRYSKPQIVHARISSELARALAGKISLFLPYVNVNIMISAKVSIRYSVLDAKRKIVRIDRVTGIAIMQTSLFKSNRLQKALNVSKYRFLIGSDMMFFGIVKDRRKRTFSYYVYTSKGDMKRRGFEAVLERSDQSIRKKLRPLVATFADFKKAIK